MMINKRFTAFISNQNEDTANENRPRTNQPDVATNQAVQTSKPMIRKGPNIKLPSVSLLEEPQVIEPDEDWITDKRKNLMTHYFTLMYLQKYKM